MFDWNELIKQLGTSIPVVLVLAYAWQRESRRADSEASKRDDDNKSWADRYAALAHSIYGQVPPPPKAVDIAARLS